MDRLMSDLTRRSALLPFVAVIVGCGGQGATPAPTPARAELAASAPCAATVAEQDLTTWRTVAAEGFSFCIPPEWTAEGHVWTRGGGKLTWGTGERPNGAVRTQTRLVTAAELSRMESNADEASADRDVQRSTPVIDGRIADVFRNRIGTKYRTGAQWSDPRVWFTGEASSAEAADLEITIMKTVRFAKP